MMTRRLFLKGSAAAALGLATALNGCAETSVSGSKELRPAPAAAAPAQSGPYRPDRLTGAQQAKAAAGNRLVGVMVNNICGSAKQNARPQRGLSAADVLVECKVEGGITRFCALYSGVDAIPEVGPVRSGRDQYLQLLLPFGALYCHEGESIFCTKFVKDWDYSGHNIGGGSQYDTPVHPLVSHRNSRGRDVAFEHTLFTSGKELRQSAEKAGLSLKDSGVSTLFTFVDYRTGEPNGLTDGERAVSAAVYFSDRYRSYFEYNSQKKCYEMLQYGGATKTITKTVDESTGTQLTFANVVLCLAEMEPYPGDSHGVQNVDFAAGGTAWVLTRGRVKSCRWEKPAPDARLRLLDGEGKELRLNIGKTYLGLVDTDQAERLRFESKLGGALD